MLEVGGAGGSATKTRPATALRVQCNGIGYPALVSSHARQERDARIIILAAGVLVLTAGIALADRPVTEQERAHLVQAIASQGCSGGKLEFDDGKFEVDDATCADGKKYDLHFDQAFNLLKKKLDD
jgi:hypothetical protein